MVGVQVWFNSLVVRRNNAGPGVSSTVKNTADFYSSLGRKKVVGVLSAVKNVANNKKNRMNVFETIQESVETNLSLSSDSKQNIETLSLPSTNPADDDNISNIGSNNDDDNSLATEEEEEGNPLDKPHHTLSDLYNDVVEKMITKSESYSTKSTEIMDPENNDETDSSMNLPDSIDLINGNETITFTRSGSNSTSTKHSKQDQNIYEQHKSLDIPIRIELYNDDETNKASRYRSCSTKSTEPVNEDDILYDHDDDVSNTPHSVVLIIDDDVTNVPISASYTTASTEIDQEDVIYMHQDDGLIVPNNRDTLINDVDYDDEVRKVFRSGNKNSMESTKVNQDIYTRDNFSIFPIDAINPKLSSMKDISDNDDDDSNDFYDQKSTKSTNTKSTKSSKCDTLNDNKNDEVEMKKLQEDPVTQQQQNNTTSSNSEQTDENSKSTITTKQLKSEKNISLNQFFNVTKDKEGSIIKKFKNSKGSLKSLDDEESTKLTKSTKNISLNQFFGVTTKSKEGSSLIKKFKKFKGSKRLDDESCSKLTNSTMATSSSITTNNESSTKITSVSSIRTKNSTVPLSYIVAASSASYKLQQTAGKLLNYCINTPDTQLTYNGPFIDSHLAIEKKGNSVTVSDKSTEVLHFQSKIEVLHSSQKYII